MGARRKLRQDQAALPAPTPRPELAADAAAAVDSPVHAQLARLEASFAAASPKPYPLAVRAAIMLGAPAALWAVVIVSVGALAKAIGA